MIRRSLFWIPFTLLTFGAPALPTAAAKNRPAPQKKTKAQEKADAKAKAQTGKKAADKSRGFEL
jgi:hypothetical protein